MQYLIYSLELVNQQRTDLCHGDLSRMVQLTLHRRGVHLLLSTYGIQEMVLKEEQKHKYKWPFVILCKFTALHNKVNIEDNIFCLCGNYLWDGLSLLGVGKRYYLGRPLTQFFFFDCPNC